MVVCASTGSEAVLINGVDHGLQAASVRARRSVLGGGVADYQWRNLRINGLGGGCPDATGSFAHCLRSHFHIAEVAVWKQPLDTLQLQYASTELLARVLGFQENYQFCGEWNLPRMAYDADADRLRSTRASDHVLPGLGVTATLRHGVAGNSATRFGYDAAHAFTNGTSSPGAAWQSVDVSDGDANVDVIATFSTPVQPCVVRIYWTDAPAMDFDIEYETPTGRGKRRRASGASTP